MKIKCVDRNQADKDLSRMREEWAEITLLLDLLFRSILNASIAFIEASLFQVNSFRRFSIKEEEENLSYI